MENNSIINSLKRLERVGDENSRVTEKLRDACSQVGGKICEIVKPLRDDDENLELPRGYKVITIDWNRGQFQDDILKGTISAVNTGRSYDYHPGNDYDSIFPGTTRDQCLQFAHDISTGLLDEITNMVKKWKAETEQAAKKLIQNCADWLG